MVHWEYLRPSSVLPSLVLLAMTTTSLYAGMRQQVHSSGDVIPHPPDAVQPYQLRMEAATIGLIGCAAWLVGDRLRRRLSQSH